LVLSHVDGVSRPTARNPCGAYIGNLADSADARKTLADLAAGAEPVSAEQFWAELGIDQ
jgi:hypothetical protein